MDKIGNRHGGHHTIEVDIDGYEDLLSGARSAFNAESDAEAVRHLLALLLNVVISEGPSTERFTSNWLQRVNALTLRELIVGRGYTRNFDDWQFRHRASVPNDDTLDAQARARGYGIDAGRFRVPPDFDEPLPDDILDAFES